MTDLAQTPPASRSADRPAPRPLTVGRVVAGLLFLLTLPLWIVAGLVVWTSVGRPLLFRQARAGQGGRTFSICKFRTMREARGSDGRPLPDALRQTRLTRLMRFSRLDELPQLLSILRGDMAFVGPRPLLPETVARFGESGRLRCTVAPGLTGWAQVNGNTCLSDEEKLALDLWYVRRSRPGLDLVILLRTALVILAGERVHERNLAIARIEMEGRGAALPMGSGA